MAGRAKRGSIKEQDLIGMFGAFGTADMAIGEERYADDRQSPSAYALSAACAARV